jgi:hypothetical protein
MFRSRPRTTNERSNTQKEQQDNDETSDDEDKKSNIERVSPPPKAPKERNPDSRRIWLQFVGNVK